VTRVQRLLGVVMVK